MSLENILRLHETCKPTHHVLEAIDDGTKLLQVEGLAASAKAWLLAHVSRSTKRGLMIITYTSEQAERIAEDLPHYGISRDSIGFFSSNEAVTFEDARHDSRVIGERLSCLHGLLKNPQRITVASIDAALSRTLPMTVLEKATISFTVGQTMDIDEAVRKLVTLGYEPTDVVDSHGEFTRRGGLVDVFPTSDDDPIRVEWFGDEIESIRHFETASQRSFDKMPEVSILPSREVLLDGHNTLPAIDRIKREFDAQLRSLLDSGQTEAADRLRDKVESDLEQLRNGAFVSDIEFYAPYFYPEEACLLDYMDEQTIVVIDEPSQIKSHWDQFEAQVLERLLNRAARGLVLASQKHAFAPFEPTMKRAIGAHQAISLVLLARHVSWAATEDRVEVHSVPADHFGGRIEAVMEQVKTWVGNGQRVVFASAQEKRMAEIVSSYEIQAAVLEDADDLVPAAYIAHAPIRSGYKVLDASLVVISDSEVFGEQRLHRPRTRSHEGIPITSVLDLKVGDYVVHINHGIAYYRGIHKLNTQGVAREYLLLEYAGKDTLYVPTEQIDRIQRYIGGEGSEPTVHRLGGSEWARATKKVSKAVEQVARELVELYAWREAVTGHAYNSDTPWQQEMESAFPYVETSDQLSAIRDVKLDLERPKVMDRLICGDVGYGKTEVAIRAAFKVASEGKQVAVLTPTTVLAQQHYNTFTERLAAFPVKIGLLSRFRGKKEQAETVEAARIGATDIVIGTHRLLSKDVQFKDLGLLIIDEEQRFGVRHKERLKQLRKNVDVLTMTATPIPRTLHMSLANIRDMSVINDPPEGRIPIQTFVEEARSEVIRDAIIRELDRGGQVFFVHNRVENIGHVAAELQRLIPYVRLDTAHGQMPESDLERVMLDFYEQKFDVLLCSTIIESGLDIPNVNTIIVNDADKLGLAQLYQLRGRVGRSDRQAYAYLLYKPDKVLSEVSEKRLAAIREFTDLGSGFRIAMRDLEIRGAGNLLGTSQSGNVAAVGFDLYCQLLARAVSELKGEAEEDIELPPVDLPVDAFIPQLYMSNEAHRILFYKKLAAVKSVEDLQAVQDEMEDRFGDPPRSVWNVLAVIRLRLRCLQVGIKSIGRFNNQVLVMFGDDVRLGETVCRDLMRTYRRHVFQSDRALLGASTHRTIADVEDLVEVIARAFKRTPAIAAR